MKHDRLFDLVGNLDAAEAALHAPGGKELMKKWLAMLEAL